MEEIGLDTCETAARALSLIGAELAGNQGVDLEYSVQLRGGLVRPRGRFACWLSGSSAERLAPITRALIALGAPPQVLEAQRTSGLPVRQGIAVAIDAGVAQFRLYLHGRVPGTLADTYAALRWRVDERPQASRYFFHYFPCAPDGRKPIDVVPSLFTPGVSALLEFPRLRQASGFWLRENSDGVLEQVDFALPWSPPASSLAGVELLGRAVSVDLPEDLAAMPTRHVAVSAGGLPPTVNLYASASCSEAAWPRDERELQDTVRSRAAAVSKQVEAELYMKVPALPDAPAHAQTIDTFYDGNLDVWRRVLGPDMHYHAGVFDSPTEVPDDAAADEAVRRSVRELYPFIPAGQRLYDVGCGWGGPLAMWTHELGCPSLGITNSVTQYRLIASRGLPVRWGDAEYTLPPGRFACAVLLESFSHIRDKLRLLRVLRPFVDRLVMRVNCQDGAPASEAFGGSMAMVSSADLRELLTASGFRIRHFRDRRMEGLPSVAVWRRRLLDVPPQPDPHIEALRSWCERVTTSSESWGRLNPLIEVVAE